MPPRRSSRSTPQEAEPLPQLTVTRDALSQQLEDRIARGQELMKQPIASDSDLQSARNDYYTWSEFNETLLQRSFTTSKPAKDYSASLGMFVVSIDPEPLAKKVAELHEDVDRKIRRLSSLKEQLPLFEEPSRAMPARPASLRIGLGTTVFVVHGHGEAFKQQVSRFLEATTDLEPVILHEQANSGRTIIGEV